MTATADPTAAAISRWDELLAAEPDLDGSIEAWRGEFAVRELELDGRPLCSVLRPHLVSEERLSHQAGVARLVMSALRKVRAAVTGDDELYRLHLGGLHEWIGHLLALEPRVAGEGALVRLDASLARTRLHFIETNADTPGGAGHNDAILDFWGLGAAERAPVREHVPWGRPLIDGRTTNADGVELGWRHDEAGWDRAIEAALANDYVVQHRVELQREDYPTMEPGAPSRSFYEDTDPFIFRGEYGGQLTRLGATEITNVHADGSVCATVALAPR